MKKTVNTLIFLGLLVFLMAELVVMRDYLLYEDTTHIVVGFIMCALTFASLVKTGKEAFGNRKNPNPKETPEAFLQGTVEPNPEMDRVDDMSVQYNPYFADVYEKQFAEQRKKQQQMEQQMQMQMEMQQRLQQQIQQEQLLQQQMLQGMLPPEQGQAGLMPQNPSDPGMTMTDTQTHNMTRPFNGTF